MVLGALGGPILHRGAWRSVRSCSFTATKKWENITSRAEYRGTTIRYSASLRDDVTTRLSQADLGAVVLSAKQPSTHANNATSAPHSSSRHGHMQQRLRIQDMAINNPAAWLGSSRPEGPRSHHRTTAASSALLSCRRTRNQVRPIVATVTVNRPTLVL